MKWKRQAVFTFVHELKLKNVHELKQKKWKH
jgi:hypothetical protein